MTQTLGLRLQSIQQIAQHGLVGLHLARVAPTGDEFGQFKQGGKQNVGYVLKIVCSAAAGGGIGQVQGHMGHTRRQRTRAARQGQHLPVWQGGEMFRGRRADNAAGTGDQQGVFTPSHIGAPQCVLLSKCLP